MEISQKKNLSTIPVLSVPHKIISWNINGIRSIEKRLGSSLQSWMDKQGSPIYCFQETKTLVPIDIPGYRGFWSYAGRKNYAGVVTYVREDLTTSKTYICDRFEESKNPNHVGRVICTDHNDFILFNVYCPNPGKFNEKITDLVEFYVWLKLKCDSYVSTGREVIIAGDFNIAHTWMDTHNDRSKVACVREGRIGLNEIITNYVDSYRHICPYNRVFTCFYNRPDLKAMNIGWRLDYILVSKNLIERIADASIDVNSVASDHRSISINIV